MLSVGLQVLLGAGFFMFGYMKFTSPKMVEGFNHFGLPQWFRVITGLFEWVGAIAIIAGIWYTPLVIWAGLWLAIIMFFAMLTHIRAKDPVASLKMPGLLFAFSLLVVILNI
ncbi:MULTISPECIES: DoxX family protein [unclassified Virgibacillus]|uniref:DoxX family protein n=1 Tax=unclassified Virgibacillus TaxID=2620237 RepID=UPI0024DE080B|nr:DoxX family protein [Virgibacillus sp. LDC-1]